MWWTDGRHSNPSMKSSVHVDQWTHGWSVEACAGPFVVKNVLKPKLSIGSWFHWWVARYSVKFNESEDQPIQENLYYFKYRLGETYGTSKNSIPFKNNVWQKEKYWKSDYFVRNSEEIFQNPIIYLRFLIAFKGENFKYTSRRWKIPAQNWGWWCKPSNIGTVWMGEARSGFSCQCWQQRVPINFRRITKIEVLETFRPRIKNIK